MFNNYWAACDRFEDIERKGQLPDDIILVLYQRRFVLAKETTLFLDLIPQLIATPMIINIKLGGSFGTSKDKDNQNKFSITGLELYEEVWGHV